MAALRRRPERSGSQADPSPEQSVQPATWALLLDERQHFARLLKEGTGPSGVAAIEKRQLQKVLRAKDSETESLRKHEAELNAKVQELIQELAKTRHHPEVDIPNKDAANREAQARMQQENAARCHAIQDSAAKEKAQLLRSLSETEKALVSLKKSTDDAIAERDRQLTMIREEHSMKIEATRKMQSDELGKLKESHAFCEEQSLEALKQPMGDAKTAASLWQKKSTGWIGSWPPALAPSRDT